MNSSSGLRLSALRLLPDNLTREPHLSWNRNLSCLGVSSGRVKLEQKPFQSILKSSVKTKQTCTRRDLVKIYFFNKGFFNSQLLLSYLTFISIRISKLLLLLILSSLKSPPRVTFRISFSIANTEDPLRQSSLLCSRYAGLVMLTCTHFPYKSTIA